MDKIRRDFLKKGVLGLGAGLLALPFINAFQFIKGGSILSSGATATLTDDVTIAWDVGIANIATITLGGNRTLDAPTNLQNGGTYILIVKQDGAGSRTLAYNAVFKWGDATAPTLTTTASAVDILTFVSDGTSLYGVSQSNFS